MIRDIHILNQMIPFEEKRLSESLIRSLYRAGITTVEQLEEYVEKDKFSLPSPQRASRVGPNAKPEIMLLLQAAKDINDLVEIPIQDEAVHQFLEKYKTVIIDKVAEKITDKIVKGIKIEL
ncbi:hypothetical protein [Bacillus salipaludis]|uniref:Uncharacterized protein n=1 Tax=Bacillus salipaludis TaxID=2547811 RepID=A0AA90R5U6_9BACI|nr:hypothetical protein [Bacillus salipaludis]MDQ6598211.1 hypothetical protein [Bacillus salipaludis]